MSDEQILERLLDVASTHAHGVILALKRPLMATWVLINAEGKVQIIGTPWRDEAEKEILVENVRRQMKKTKTIAYSLITEAWASTQPKDWKPTEPIGLRPSERPDRREIVVAMATDGKETKLRHWEIKRDWHDEVYALESLSMPEGAVESWLADLLK